MVLLVDQKSLEELLADVDGNLGNFELLQSAGGGSIRQQIAAVPLVCSASAPSSHMLKMQANLGGRHSTVVASRLPTQPARVRISAFPRFFLMLPSKLTARTVYKKLNKMIGPIQY